MVNHLQSRLFCSIVIEPGKGFGKNEKKIVTGYSESIRTITAGMRHNGLTRIMVMGSWYNEDNGVNSGSGISGNDFIKCHL